MERLPFPHEERTVKREADFLVHVDASGGKAMARGALLIAPFGSRPIDFYQPQAQQSPFQSGGGNGLTIIKLHGARFNTLSAVLPINRLCS